MATRYIDLTGQRFGRLIVLDIAGRHPGNGNIMWKCLCDCGTATVVRSQYLREGRVKTAELAARGTQSCGCLHKELASATHKTHGYSVNPDPQKRAMYDLLSELHARCGNPKSANYRYYGAVGVSVDPRWDDFEAFVTDMGVRPADGYDLARLDVRAGYTKSNCAWIEAKYRNRRERRSSKINMDIARQIRAEHKAGGITQRELAKKYGLSLSHVQKICGGRMWKEIT